VSSSGRFRDDCGMNVIFLCRGLPTLPADQRDVHATGLILAFDVDDLEVELARLQDEGVIITMPLTAEEWGERAFQVRDPNGVIVQARRLERTHQLTPARAAAPGLTVSQPPTEHGPMTAPTQCAAIRPDLHNWLDDSHGHARPLARASGRGAGRARACLLLVHPLVLRDRPAQTHTVGLIPGVSSPTAPVGYGSL